MWRGRLLPCILQWSCQISIIRGLRCAGNRGRACLHTSGHPLKRQTSLAMEWADGGKLYGIPAGEDQIRMYHPTLVIFDDAAFLPGFEACYNATTPVAQQIVAISSAAPGFFADQCTL